MKIMLVLAKDNIYRYDSVHQRKYYPQITLLTLESLIDNKYNAEITIIDEGVEKYDATSEKYRNIKFDLICVSCVISGSRRAKEIAAFWKEREAYTIIGGHYANVLKEEALKYFDTVIKGPAEVAFPLFLEDFAKGNPKREYFCPVGDDYEYRPLNRKLLTNRKYYRNFGTIVANNGCRNRCSYCSVTKMHSGQNQLRSIGYVVDEIKRNRYRKWIFYDPNFLSDRKYAMDLMEKLKSLKIKWTASATIDVGNDPEALKLMKESGCIGLVIGLESFVQENLNNVNKGFNNVKKYKELVGTIQSYGISVLATLMIGMETDTVESIRKIPDIVEEIGIDIPRYNILTPYPGTPFFKQLQREGRLLTTDWFYYDTETVVFKPKNMSYETLQEEFYKLWLDTFTYRRIFKRIRTSKNKGLKFILEVFSRQHAKKFRKYKKKEWL